MRMFVTPPGYGLESEEDSGDEEVEGELTFGE